MSLARPPRLRNSCREKAGWVGCSSCFDLRGLVGGPYASWLAELGSRGTACCLVEGAPPLGLMVDPNSGRLMCAKHLACLCRSRASELSL